MKNKKKYIFTHPEWSALKIEIQAYDEKHARDILFYAIENDSVFILKEII